MAFPRPHWTAAQTYTFTGQLATGTQTQTFQALAGAPPTITGGFTKINTLDRPRRKGFTMPVGWDPISIDVPIRFEYRTNYGQYGLYGSANQLEIAIQKLEWMAGRGQLYDSGTPTTGDPPTVWVGSYLADGKTVTDLIPRNLHDSTGQHPSLTFLVAGLQYDPNPIRGPEGSRLRQDVTVSLIEQVTVPGTVQTTRQRQQGRNTNQNFTTHTTTAARNTIQKVCQHIGITSPAAWAQVVAFNADRLHVRSYHQDLKPGTTIQIPQAVLQHK